MKNTMKRTLGFVLALALILTAIGCGVAYADSYRGGERGKPVTVENPYKTPAAPVMEEPVTPAAEKPAVEVEKSPAVVEKPAPAKSEPAPSQEPLTVEQAKAIALEALGLSNAHFTEVERDDGKYELELCDGKREYDVEVGIFSGKVREIDRDDDACDHCDDDWDDDDWDDDDWNDDWDD